MRSTLWIGTVSALIVFVLPQAAFAAVTITQIMFDPAGSNTGRQWIQIVNSNSTAVDLTGYKLFQNSTNHGIALVSGTTTLDGRGVAIIANNPDKFLIDYPSYTGALYKSAFSLRVSGDRLDLKDNKLATLDSVSYSEDAVTEGNALYRVGNELRQGAPDPSAYHATLPAALVPTEKTSVTAAKNSSIVSAKSKSSATSKGAGTTKSSRSVGTQEKGNAGELAAADTATIGIYPLMEIVAGSAAFGIVVVAGLLLSNRFNPKPQVQEVAVSSVPSKKSEADEYEIL